MSELPNLDTVDDIGCGIVAEPQDEPEADDTTTAARCLLDLRPWPEIAQPFNPENKP